MVVTVVVVPADWASAARESGAATTASNAALEKRMAMMSQGESFFFLFLGIDRSESHFCCQGTRRRTRMDFS